MAEGYSSEEIRGMTEKMVRGANPNFTDEQVEQVVNETIKEIEETVE